VKESGGSIMVELAGTLGEIIALLAAVLVIAATVSSDAGGGEEPTEEECKQRGQECRERCYEETTPILAPIYKEYPDLRPVAR
jgi:hypothetical protein